MYSAELQAAGLASAAAAPDPKSIWRRAVEPLEPFLSSVARRLEEQVDSFDPEVAPLARYALTNQGKQLRPVLVALSAGTAGPLGDDVVTAAVIIEMIHLATLVHDDVMDEAALRRSRPTLAARWDNQVSVLLGDCLFAHALKLASAFPTTEVCRAVATSTKTVCSGEILQSLHRHEAGLSREEYFRILRMKTADLFALSCDLGASLAGAAPSHQSALRQFGLDLGIAYQIYDDCVDLFGTEANAGKSLGTDLVKGKLTLPLLVVLERASPAERITLRSLLAHSDARSRARVCQLLDSHHALAECRRTFQDFLTRARHHLATLPESRSREALVDLTWYLSRQTETLGTGLEE